jgi:hypothetical protein
VLTGFSDGQIDRRGIRAFEVVEAQLAFLYDHFFIEHLQLDLRRSPAQSISLPVIIFLFEKALVLLVFSFQRIPAHMAVRSLVGVTRYASLVYRNVSYPCPTLHLIRIKYGVFGSANVVVTKISWFLLGERSANGLLKKFPGPATGIGKT